ncbi:hypothetical protein BFL36_09395 [Clavibacter michiganensis]|uniref:Uncharacterized protein n=1 Tax=Clavibacter michiganensis TaxID=28447 RepID=A0A251YF15_9MICO|nr:hypothetical protein [Clavibacter michiganensis]OUE22688.1 hypothetical protein BFL36_09395 [Clavibacter michiganensis]
MAGRPPARSLPRARRAVVAMMLVAAPMPLVAHLAPDLAAACWSAGAVLTVGALVVALRSRRRPRR